VAALLIALAPAVSRILASHAGNASTSLVEMCTATGLKLIDLSLSGGKSDPMTPMPHMDEACGYCVLAAPLLLVAALLTVPHLRPAPTYGRHFYCSDPALAAQSTRPRFPGSTARALSHASG
jgi:hypothetical protein